MKAGDRVWKAFAAGDSAFYRQLCPCCGEMFIECRCIFRTDAAAIRAVWPCLKHPLDPLVEMVMEVEDATG